MRFLTGTVMGEDAERRKQIERAETGEEPVYKSRGGFIPEEELILFLLCLHQVSLSLRERQLKSMV